MKIFIKIRGLTETTPLSQFVRTLKRTNIAQIQINGGFG